MRAIGYFREPAAAGHSLAEQNRAFLEFCAREGYEVAGSFVDGASSNGHAPGFRQMIAYLREHDAGLIVVVPSVDALGADLRDATVRYFQIESIGARVKPIDGSGDADGEIVAAWNATDGGRLAERVRAAMRRKAVKGEVLGRPPYGYKVGNRRRLELVADEAVVVRYIFRLYLQDGMGIRLIARRLNQEELKTRRGGNWSMVSIRDILKNRAYLGTYIRFGVRVPGNHRELVSAEDFRLVQDRLNARRTSYAPRVPSQFLLSGIAYCGYCGNRLIGVSRKQAWKRRNGEQVSNTYRYYQCESRTNQSVCGYHTRRADVLEALVRGAVADEIAAAGGFPASIDDAGDLAAQRGELDRLRARGRALDRRLEGYVDAAARGRMPKDRMRKLSLRVAADRLSVEDAIERAERNLDQHASASERKQVRDRAVAHLLDAWDELAFAERQAALRDAVARVTVFDDSFKLTLRP